VVEPSRDLLKIFGTLLLILGVSVWIVYGLLRYGMGCHVTALQFLPYHLAGVVPGVVLRRHRFFRSLIRRLF